MLCLHTSDSNCSATARRDGGRAAAVWTGLGSGNLSLTNRVSAPHPGPSPAFVAHFQGHLHSPFLRRGTTVYIRFLLPFSTASLKFSPFSLLLDRQSLILLLSSSQNFVAVVSSPGLFFLVGLEL